MPKRTGLFGAPIRRSTSPFGGSPQSYPAPRNRAFEEQLCDAITRHKLVELRYDDDLAFRTFAPHAVYRSMQDKVNVAGTQLENPEQPLDSLEPRNFEVGKLRELRVTERNFRPDTRFDRHNPRYQNGMICSV